MILQTIKNNRIAVWFLGKFLLVYFILNSLYGVFVEHYKPGADPFTVTVAKHTAILLSVVHENISMNIPEESSHVPVRWNGTTVINIFEGCNAINVWIVFVSFVVAFSSTWYRSWRFLMVGTAIIYLVNLFRVAMLFWIAFYFFESLYLFHKFFFTAGIYAVVFMLWYYHIRKIKMSRNES